MASFTQVQLPAYVAHASHGKVREIFKLSASELLFVTTDRISAFDVIMSNGIPDRGSVLTQLSNFWFRQFRDSLPDLKTHILLNGLPDDLRTRLVSDIGHKEVTELEKRSMVVKSIRMLPVESIVRGYITGSAWASYQQDGTVCGIKLPAGLEESEKLPQTLWTPSTKAPIGQKDENISPEEAANLIGGPLAKQIEELSLKVYNKASEYAAQRGIIIADTKFEFGLDDSTKPPTLVLCDEVLTPDSSRFWDASNYEIGRPQESFDKQYLRDWLVQTGQKGKDGVSIPQEVADATNRRYKDAFQRLVGSAWDI